MPSVTNIAVYQFATLSELKSLRERLLMHGKSWNLKGTILLSPEGINLFMAGAADSVEKMLCELRAIPGLETLTPKYSRSLNQPFNRLLVRIKKEIIAFGVDGINPAEHTSRKLSAATLKQWLDEGKPVTLLDTRNAYEVKLGTFKNATILDLDHFRQFPAAVQQLPSELKAQPIVMFCTGGIRCEKAGPFMEREGYREIFQLEGGILKYFEECGGAHYEGECFVFDQRVGVDPALCETESLQCFNCLTPLTEDDQKNPLYLPGQQCPYCQERSQKEKAESMRRHQEKIREVSTPLPGSKAYDNEKPVIVPPAYDGATLLDFLSGLFAHTPREAWEARCQAGRWRCAQGPVVSAEHIVKAGERYHHLQPGSIEPEVSADITILHEDEAILVLDKPAPLPMHPSGRFHRNTLQSILQAAYFPQKPRPAHRLDANTSGVVVCARTRHFARLLQSQFEEGTVEKTYLAQVRGQPTWNHFLCEAPISRDAYAIGSREIDEEAGLPAQTEFWVRERRSDQTTLLEVRPHSGRTNQIRVHLWDLGFPVWGDAAYLPERKIGAVQTLRPSDPPLHLLAWKLNFMHPLSQERVTFTALPREWV